VQARLRAQRAVDGKGIASVERRIVEGGREGHRFSMVYEHARRRGAA
jgi:hypothetical protein